MPLCQDHGPSPRLTILSQSSYQPCRQTLGISGAGAFGLAELASRSEAQLRMAVEVHQRCAACHQAATLACVGCKDAPEYQPADSTGAFYCDQNCQKRHWLEHKDRCRILQQRKKLLRSAKLLKEALLTYRAVLYDLHLDEVRLEDGTLWLHQTPSPRPMRGLFPEHVTTNLEHREAALAVNQCTASMAILGRLTRKLLEGEQAPSLQRCDPGLILTARSKMFLRHSRSSTYTSRIQLFGQD